MARFDSLDDWLRWQEQYHPRPIDLGLERVAAVFRQLAGGQVLPVTVTVGGTNGKGSTVAYLESMCRAAGYKVGAYTSPHIIRYNERIRIDGSAVADDDICAAFERIDSVRGATSLSYFEFGTLAALDIFRRRNVDVQILEVGMGGRLDAVNIIDADAAIVTTIGLDHVEWLGGTVDAIGREKAGIFRPDRPAIIGDDQAPRSLFEVAEDKGARLFALGADFSYVKQQGVWRWIGQGGQINDLPQPFLQGEHQYRNAAAAIMALRSIATILPVADLAIREGLVATRLPGRFQLLAGTPAVLVDVGHNPQAVATLHDYLQDAFPAVRIHAVFAIMKDKDIASVLSLMRDRVDTWYLAPLKSPRAADHDLLMQHFVQQGIAKVHGGHADFADTYTAATLQAGPDDLILVFGSFLLVSDCLSHFDPR
ncbi:MAG: bifunctional tetrahydrofolate synthase/dihydrofolate synthase [Methylomonas sp.]|nr:bifunctional tetrahydrofolate synthase/dihydrofolate synthase [Methylomonas sp.]PPD21241.1 MAG: bifunctional tetrahydrofolate synthase/dihydrofolate synthase [Methylomonas sp.]PPD27651.1 MAG: bifunctional tetrahydrofolate synthase/dihydrofolate synthase [Methylomonas sp.]PPD38207.1 MAG: bifunctional tetrahydrofolate synthase/dihydrofolate synthase [Methylomonas sp.]PPD39637.1 MAG: bifunctional tetrahydrofolate synthase/dihydrofolate synthase [Methylomonas sp.]